MPLNARRLRLWFAAAAVLLIAVVVGSYFYARHRVRMAIKALPAKLGVEIQQTANGFTLCKSDGPRTLFCIHASKTLQYKEGGRAQLHDVNIIVYGRKSDRFDQIYGQEFDYDPQTGVVRAAGDVHIDLQSDAKGAAHPDQAPPEELKNPVHVKTSGLEFNQKTGIARTTEIVEIRTPQASGSAKGALYDSKAGTLTLDSQIVIHTSGKTAGDIEARHGVISKEPMEAALDGVHGTDGSGDFSANSVRVFFRDDGTTERAIASGGVSASRAGAKPASARAQTAEVSFDERSNIRNATLSGNVVVDSAGPRTLHAEAGRVLVSFSGKNRVEHVKALDNVKLTQRPELLRGGRDARSARGTNQSSKQPRDAGVTARGEPSPQSLQLTAATVDVDVKGGRVLEHAYTTGTSQISIDQAGGELLGGATSSAAAGTGKPAQAAHTTISAGRFDATFDSNNRLRVLHGAPDTKIVSSTPGQPDRTTTSREMDVAFVPGGTGITSIQQQGDFHYSEGARTAIADRGRYTAADEVFQLSGAPRYSDAGVSLGANTLRLNRKTGDVLAEGEVKTTYADLKPQNGGAMLASGNPIHVTAAAMSARRTAGIAHFTGGARLWQDANIVEAPTIDFDKEHRTMLAAGVGSAIGASPISSQRVTTVFSQAEKSGKVTSVNVSAVQLTYSDSQRLAQFTGGVEMRSTDTTVTADRADVILQPRAVPASMKSGPPQNDSPIKVQGVAPGSGAGGSSGATSSSAATAPGPSQLQQIVGDGHVLIQQPGRRATGNRLVYTAQDGKFVLTGGPPSIFDAERGTITGNSLTFFSRDDRVLVESNGTTRTVTQTNVTK